MLRSWFTLCASGLCALACGTAATAPPAAAADPDKPTVYALVAALGGQFSIVWEVPSTGSHLSRYRRKPAAAPGDALNRLALHGLDQAIEGVDPGSTRLYLSLPPAQIDAVAPDQRETAALSAVVAALQEMPQRRDWDRIVVATPAYRALDANGLGSKLQGFGIFDEPVCQAACGNFLDVVPREIAAEPPGGVDALTMDDQTIKARTFIAPFSYIAVWVLDPKTLAVLDKEEGFDNQKLAEPAYKLPLDLSDAQVQNYLAGRMAHLVAASIGAAVVHSALNVRHGKVNVGPVRIVDPADAGQ
jgi:hypothetical protein